MCDVTKLALGGCLDRCFPFCHVSDLIREGDGSHSYHRSNGDRFSTIQTYAQDLAYLLTKRL